MHPRTRTRGLWWCVLLALGAGGLTPGALRAQPPVPTEVVIPVKTSGTVGTQVGPMIKKIEVIPPIAEVRLTPDLKGLEITPADTGFIQVRLLDAANNLLQVINVQAVPPDLEIPFGDTKVFQAAPGAT